MRRLGTAPLAALHDLNLAAAWCDRVVALDGGRVVAAGPPAEALRPELVSRVFAVTATAFTHPVIGCHQLSFSPW